MELSYIVFVACVVSVYGKVTPDYFPSCRRSDPSIDKCVLDGIEAMRPYLKKGIPELNIPPLEPFTVPTLKLDRTAPNLRIKATIKHAKAYGGGNFRIEKFRLNLNNKYAAELKIVIPKLTIVTDYNVHGSKLLTLDINGKGKLRGNLTNVVAVAKASAKPITRDGVEYLQVDKVITKVKIPHAQISVDDTDRPVAATSTAAFFNASPGLILDVVSPLIDETTGAVAKAFFNKVLGSMPIKEVLLDDDAPAA